MIDQTRKSLPAPWATPTVVELQEALERLDSKEGAGDFYVLAVTLDEQPSTYYRVGQVRTARGEGPIAIVELEALTGRRSADKLPSLANYAPLEPAGEDGPASCSCCTGARRCMAVVRLYDMPVCGFHAGQPEDVDCPVCHTREHGRPARSLAEAFGVVDPEAAEHGGSE